MPVLFVLDRNMEKDLHTVTLSYTFFDIGTKARVSGLQSTSVHG
jgi:cytochrome c oxidase assembly protein subunit 11